jgi:hypothetical protein|tara:strand:+ start:411 stop:995 length:585 start_codon:yes stop_codon:yes gene_type:complete
MSASIINIKSEDILENLENLMHNSSVFKTNSNVNNINCTIFYFDNHDFISYKKNEIEIKDNLLSKTELMKLILNNNKHHSKNFDLTGIYKFEVNLKEDELRSFCSNPEKHSFLKKYKNIQDVTFSPSIKILNDSNSVFLFFTKKSKKNIDEKSNEEKSESVNEKKNGTRKKVKFELSEKVLGNIDHTKTSKKYA